MDIGNWSEVSMVRLVELDLTMEAEFRRFLAELQQEENADRWLLKYHNKPFDTLVAKLKDQKAGKQLPDGWVPSSLLFLVDESGRFLGRSSLRHKLNDFLRNIGGHIGYYVCPSQRRKGYGTEILKLTLEKARELGLKKVLVTCDEDNIASAKIIEKNGGVLKDMYQSDDMGVAKYRYWIEL